MQVQKGNSLAMKFCFCFQLTGTTWKYVYNHNNSEKLKSNNNYHFSRCAFTYLKVIITLKRFERHNETLPSLFSKSLSLAIQQKQLFYLKTKSGVFKTLRTTPIR